MSTQRRISALRRLAASTTFPPERRAALAKAAQLEAELQMEMEAFARASTRKPQTSRPGDAIKAMFAERAEQESRQEAARKDFDRSERRWNRIGKVLFGRIDRAAPFIDADSPPGNWPPSALLKIMYCACATAPRAEAAREAALEVLSLLDKARQLWRDGYHPNPFVKEPARRA